MVGCRLPKEPQTLLAGCSVILVPDLDRAAMHSTVNNGSALAQIADSVRVARLPGKVKAKGDEDVRDVIKRGGPEAIKNAILNA